MGTVVDFKEFRYLKSSVEKELSRRALSLYKVNGDSALLPSQPTKCAWYVSFESQKGIIWEPEGHYPYSMIFQWESERCYSLYKVYSNSALLVLKLTSLNSVNALLVLSRQYIFILKHVYYLLCTFVCTLYCSRHQCRTLRMSVLSILYLMVQYSRIFKLFILKVTILMCFDPSLCIIPFVGKKSDRKISAAFMMQI